jgi:hypothetical protein
MHGELECAPIRIDHGSISVVFNCAGIPGSIKYYKNPKNVSAHVLWPPGRTVDVPDNVCAWAGIFRQGDKPVPVFRIVRLGPTIFFHLNRDQILLAAAHAPPMQEKIACHPDLDILVIDNGFNFVIVHSIVFSVSAILAIAILVGRFLQIQRHSCAAASLAHTAEHDRGLIREENIKSTFHYLHHFLVSCLHNHLND